MSKELGERMLGYERSGGRLAVVYFSKSTAIGPTSRYRIFQYLLGLEACGIDCKVYPLFDETYWKILEIPSDVLRATAKTVYVIGRFLRRVMDILTIGTVDLVVIEGQLFPYMPALVERILARFGYRIALEYDDAIYLMPGHRRKIPALLGVASGAIVGNEVLAQYAADYTSRVCVVPTVVDTKRFVPRQVQGQRSDVPVVPIRVVWIGLAYNLPYLDIVAPALKELQDQGLITLRVVCSRPPQWSELAVEFRAWELEREVELLQDCDLGIMPLPDNEWARSKCGLKLLQYMAVGLSTIASPVGVNKAILQEGVNGFLATTEDEWRVKLKMLCCNADLREQMGKAGRQTVVDQYSLEAWTPKLAACYWDLASDHTTAVFKSVVPQLSRS
jgi:glycosyltransferase involved in cell wall biosynthesis